MARSGGRGKGRQAKGNSAEGAGMAVVVQSKPVYPP